MYRLRIGNNAGGIMRLIMVVVIALVVYMVQYRVYRRNWETGLSVKLFFADEYVETGEKSELVEVVNNAKLLPLPVFHIKFSLSGNLELSDMENVIFSDAYHRNDAFSVMGNQKVTRTVSFTAKKRGMYGINGVNITARDFFMTKSFARKIKNDAYICVLPQKLESPEMDALMNKTLGETASKISLNEDMLSVDGIRRYERGDSVRRINWCATARCDELMVNTYRKAAEFKVQILLDVGDGHTGELDELSECAISLASTAAKKLIDDGIPVALLSNGIDALTGECEYVPCGSSEEHRITIDRTLSRISKSAGSVLQSLTVNDRNMAYLVVSPYCSGEIIKVLDDMVSEERNVYVMVPYIGSQPVKTDRDYIYGVEVKTYGA
jgi:uncharacterized protein (DUF58 family)